MDKELLERIAAKVELPSCGYMEATLTERLLAAEVLRLKKLIAELESKSKD